MNLLQEFGTISGS